SFTSTIGVAPTTISDAAAPALSATWNVIPLGQAATVQYKAVVASNIAAGTTITNTATTKWTSLPGTTNPSSPFNPDGRERTGAGGVDDYTRTSNGQVRIAAATVAKNLASTSEPSTADPNATIGEVITYDARVTLAEGVRSNLVFTDQLPDGLAFVPGSVQI